MQQLCINFTNERLAKGFVDVVFKREQAEYLSEGVPWEAIVYVRSCFPNDFVSSNRRYKDNSACVEMISGRAGDSKYLSMFSILDEQSSLPKCTDVTLVDAFHKQFATHANYEKPRFGKESFVIKHFAGSVT